MSKSIEESINASMLKIQSENNAALYRKWFGDIPEGRKTLNDEETRQVQNRLREQHRNRYPKEPFNRMELKLGNGLPAIDRETIIRWNDQEDFAELITSSATWAGRMERRGYKKEDRKNPSGFVSFKFPKIDLKLPYTWSGRKSEDDPEGEIDFENDR